LCLCTILGIARHTVFGFASDEVGCTPEQLELFFLAV